MEENPSDLEELNRRLDELAREKSFLQLMVNLFNEIVPVSGIEALAGSILRGLLNVIGGTDLCLYCRYDGALHFTDLGGTHDVLEEISDPDVEEVFRTGKPRETVSEFNQTMMLSAVTDRALTWIYPLKLSGETFGVLKIENIPLTMQSFGAHLVTLFTYIAMALQNEIRSRDRLKKAYDELALENSQRRRAEEELRHQKEVLEIRVAERTAELERLNEALREGSEAYQAILNSSSAGFWRADTEGKLLDVNSRYEELSGYSRAELLTMTISDLEARESSTETRNRIQEMNRQGYGRFESRHRRKDGTVWDVEISCSFPTSRVRVFYVFIQDIGPRKRAEEELRQRERILSASQNLGKVGGWEWNEENQLLYCTDETYRILELLKETSPHEDIRPEDCPVLKKAYRACLDSQVLYDQETACTPRPGETIWIRTTAEPVLEGGRAVRVVGNIMDVTERKQYQEERVRMEKLRSLGVLAGGIAHDFNNILTGIMGNISLARMSLSNEQQAARLLKSAEDSSERAGLLARQLLTFARGGAPVKRALSLKEILDPALGLALGGSNVKGLLEVEPELNLVEADEGQMGQVFNNLVLNARQSMPGGGTVTVRAKNCRLEGSNPWGLAAGDYVQVVVEDRGCGIPEADLGLIFDPYFTTKAKGSGLGLASVQSIVNRHGGSVSVSSCLGEGTTFTLRLPASRREDGPSGMTEEKCGETVRPREADKPLSILVMDDEELIRNLVQNILEFSGYAAVTCGDGSRAVKLYREARERGEPFAAVITDLTVPGGMGGAEAAREILTLDPGACLIVSSGYSQDPVMADPGTYGFCGAVGKPYKIDELKQILETVLARGGH